MCYVVLRVLIALLGTTALVKHCQRTLARGAALLHSGYMALNRKFTGGAAKLV